MKKNWLLTTLLATVTIAMGTTTTAFASPPTDITPEHPGGVTAPHSPDGIPSNIEGAKYAQLDLCNQVRNEEPRHESPGHQRLHLQTEERHPSRRAHPGHIRGRLHHVVVLRSPPQGSRILRLHVQLQPGNTSACGSR